MERGPTPGDPTNPVPESLAMKCTECGRPGIWHPGVLQPKPPAVNYCSDECRAGGEVREGLKMRCSRCGGPLPTMHDGTVSYMDPEHTGTGRYCSQACLGLAKKGWR